MPQPKKPMPAAKPAAKPAANTAMKATAKPVAKSMSKPVAKSMSKPVAKSKISPAEAAWKSDSAQLIKTLDSLFDVSIKRTDPMRDEDRFQESFKVLEKFKSKYPGRSLAPR